VFTDRELTNTRHGTSVTDRQTHSETDNNRTISSTVTYVGSAKKSLNTHIFLPQKNLAFRSLFHIAPKNGNTFLHFSKIFTSTTRATGK